MNISHIEHLGIAVKSLEEAIPYYENILQEIGRPTEPRLRFLSE